jgi:hypothetical protein
MYIFNKKLTLNFLKYINIKNSIKSCIEKEVILVKENEVE